MMFFVGFEPTTSIMIYIINYKLGHTLESFIFSRIRWFAYLWEKLENLLKFSF
jgi:hypothetical protein